MKTYMTIRFAAVRLLSAMVLATTGFCLLQASAQVGRARVPLTSVTVASAIEKAGVHVTPEQIDMPASVTADQDGPSLFASSAQLLNDGRIRLRMSCREAQSCLPFFATLRMDNQAAALSALDILSSSSQAKLPMKKAKSNPSRPGEHATLLMTDRQMQIAVPVVFLDSGEVGREVRVSSLDHKKIFQAIVISDGVVRGQLP